MEICVSLFSNHRFIFCVLASIFFVGCAGEPSNKSISSATENQQKITSEATELKLNEFYKFPVGPKGLEPSAKLLSLNNQRVHITGYMVEEEDATKGLFMIAPLPVSLSEKEDGPADDLPAATVFVHVPAADQNKIITYRPGLWELTGILQLGNQDEANGRMSYTRLILDSPAH